MGRDKIKIGEFVRVLDRGGIESFIINNLSVMNREGFDIVFILTRNKEEAYDDAVKKLGCRKESVVIKNEYGNGLKKSIESFIAFYKYFRLNHYDIVHFHAISPGVANAMVIFAAKFAHVKRIVLHSHMGIPVSDIRHVSRIKWLIGRKLISIFGTDYVSCSDLAEKYAFSPSELRKKNHILIKNGIDLDRFRYDESVRDAWRKQLGFSDKYIIGSISRFADFKNHTFMIDILEECLNIREDVILFLVGGEIEGQDYVLEDLKRKVKKKGLSDKVVFYGESHNVPELLHVMDVFLMPSFREGFSIASVEAQCTGIKFIASDKVTGMMRLTENYMVLSLEAGAQKWAKLATTCNNGYERKDCSRIIAEQGYDIKDTAKDIEKMYNSVLG